jgi:hypothetical protein
VVADTAEKNPSHTNIEMSEETVQIPKQFWRDMILRSGSGRMSGECFVTLQSIADEITHEMLTSVNTVYKHKNPTKERKHNYILAVDCKTATEMAGKPVWGV